MKTLTPPGMHSDAAMSRLELDVLATVSRLFARCPTLAGFAVRDPAALEVPAAGGEAEGEIRETDLFVTDIGFFPRLGEDQHGEVLDEIAVAIAELVHEHPQAREVLLGRTFARTLQ